MAGQDPGRFERGSVSDAHDCRAGAATAAWAASSAAREVRRQRRGEARARSPLARVLEGEAVGVEELALEAVARGAAVGRVAGQRVADRGEVGADLVGAAGLQPRLQVGLPRQQLQHLKWVRAWREAAPETAIRWRWRAARPIGASIVPVREASRPPASAR